MIRSAKPGGFCAGADLKTILACTTAAEVEAFVVRGLAVLDHLSRLAVPTVAVVHGVCLGGGLELALACRRRVALASPAPLQVGTPEVQHGLIPGWGAITQLPRLIGPENALDLLISGRSIGYLQARSLGIVDRLAAEGDSREALELMESSPETGADLAERGLGGRLEPRTRADRRATGGLSRGPVPDPGDRRDRRRPRTGGRANRDDQSPGRDGGHGGRESLPGLILSTRASGFPRLIGPARSTPRVRPYLGSRPISSPSPMM